MKIFRPSQKKLGWPRIVAPMPGYPSNGDSHPPKKNTAVSAEMRIMLAYSARKKSANAIPEYSTWKPATISDSPSATSKGARFVSAIPEMKYTMKSGNSHNQFHDRIPPACVATILPRFMLPVAMRTPTSANPMAISYDTICAAERMAPRKAYFEFAAQPAMMTP